MPKDVVARIVAGQKNLMRALAQNKGEQAIKDALAKLIDLSVGSSKRKLDSATRNLRVETQYSMLMSSWFLSFLRTDPAIYLSKVKVPVLVVAGSKDLQVPPSLNVPVIQAALKSASNDRVTVNIHKGLNHLLQTAKTGLVREYRSIEETVSEGVLKKLVDWVRSIPKG